MDIIQKIKTILERGDSRSSKMKKNTVAMFGIRGLSIFISLLSAPIMLSHVNRADYGVLMTLTSIVNWVSLMDIGLGNGLRNKLPVFMASGDMNKAKEAVSSCYAALAIYVGALILVFIAVSPFCDWLKILNSPNSDAREILGLANVVFIAFCIQFLLGLVNSVLFAYQMPAFNSLFGFFGQLLAFLALIVQVFVLGVTSAFQIGAVNCLMPPLVILIGSLFLYRGRLKDVAPSIKFVKLSSVKGIIGLGMKFFVLQIITIVLFQANAIIIAQAVGPESVVEYNLSFKYVSLITMIFNIALAPIWSATTDAYVRDDYDWIRKTLKYIRKVCLITIGVGIVMFAISKPVYHIWLGKDQIEIPYITTGLILLYISFEMLYKVYGTIINGTGKVYAQMIITGAIALAYIPFAFFMGKLLGLSGVLFANCVVFFLNYIWAKVQCTKILNRTAKGFWSR